MHAPLFTAPVILVEQPQHLYSHEGHYEVLSESGHPLAYVNEHMTAWSHHRQDSHRPHRFTIYGAEGHPLLTLDKPWDRGRPYIYVTGPHGEPYGSIVQDRSFMGSRFRLNDPRGHTIAEIRGDWGGWDFTVLDHHKTEIARIGKEHPGLTGRFFTTEDRYALEFAYDLPWPLRRLVIGAAITIDVLLHEREPDFYHSHYADFHRYPEYGYEPRHHWHHPRRGYVVNRRVRRPLAARDFRPVRRRGYSTFGARSEAPRRTRASRSTYGRAEAPRRTARADRGTTSRGTSGSGSASRRGGGFDSRSEAAARRNRAGGASRSESPSSGAAARRERQDRSGAGRQSSTGERSGSGRPSSGGSTSRAGGLFGGSSGSNSTSRAGGLFGGSSGSNSSSRSSPMRAGGSSRSSSSSRSGGASRSSGGFRSSGGSRSGGSSRRSSGGGRSGGSSRRSGGGRSSRNR